MQLGGHASQANSMAAEGHLLKTGVIALYYSVIDMVMTV
jgi:hypothetical protein